MKEELTNEKSREANDKDIKERMMMHSLWLDFCFYNIVAVLCL